MSFFKFKSLVLSIKIVTKLLLLRPFGNVKVQSLEVKASGLRSRDSIVL